MAKFLLKVHVDSKKLNYMGLKFLSKYWFFNGNFARFPMEIRQYPSLPILSAEYIIYQSVILQFYDIVNKLNNICTYINNVHSVQKAASIKEVCSILKCHFSIVFPSIRTNLSLSYQSESCFYKYKHILMYILKA